MDLRIRTWMFMCVVSTILGQPVIASAAKPTLVPLNDLIPKAVRDRIDQKRQLRSLSSYQAEWNAADAWIQGEALPPKVDLRSRDTEVKRQFGGTCTTFGLTAAMENWLGNGIDISERHMWSLYKKYSAQTALNTLKKKGAIEENWWPINSTSPLKGYSKAPRYQVTKSEYFEDDIQRAVQALSQGTPLYFGVSTPKDMIACKSRISPDSGVSNGGHAFAVVGYELDPSEPAGGYFILKNSWGTQCGDHGYQWFPFSLCQKSNMYCLIWAIEGVVKN